MKPWKIVSRSTATDEATLVLWERDGEYVIRVGGQWLMSSRSHGSESAMAEAGLARTGADLQVLIGGLGCGYTLRATLDRLGPAGRVTVAEISQSVIDWNRGPLGPLSGQPLDDARVTVERADVAKVVQRAPADWDAILLDVDNGPEALTLPTNHWLYEPMGLQSMYRGLREDGRLVIWSAGPDAAFARRLRAEGFAVEERLVPARGGTGRGSRHTLFVAVRGGG